MVPKYPREALNPQVIGTHSWRYSLGYHPLEYAPSRLPIVGGILLGLTP